jgi:hypothetical protein
MQLPGLDDLLRDISNQIENTGRYIAHISAGEDMPQFSYTIGLHGLHGHPEILAVGLPVTSADPLLHNASYLVARGSRFDDGNVCTDLLDGYALVFAPVRREMHERLFGLAFWHYGAVEFPTLQCIWPDREGRYPWNEAADAEMRSQQQIFC